MHRPTSWWLQVQAQFSESSAEGSWVCGWGGGERGPHPGVGWKISGAIFPTLGLKNASPMRHRKENSLGPNQHSLSCEASHVKFTTNVSFPREGGCSILSNPVFLRFRWSQNLFSCIPSPLPAPLETRGAVEGWFFSKDCVSYQSFCVGGDLVVFCFSIIKLAHDCF